MEGRRQYQTDPASARGESNRSFRETLPKVRDGTAIPTASGLVDVRKQKKHVALVTVNSSNVILERLFDFSSRLELAFCCIPFSSCGGGQDVEVKCGKEFLGQ